MGSMGRNDMCGYCDYARCPFPNDPIWHGLPEVRPYWNIHINEASDAAERWWSENGEKPELFGAACRYAIRKIIWRSGKGVVGTEGDS